MKPTNFKYVPITNAQAIVDNAAFTTATVDTKGFDYAVFIVQFGAMDIAMAELLLNESDASNMGSAVAVLTYGTSTNLAGSTSALPSATADNTAYAFRVDLRGRKRYMDVSATGGDGSAGTYLSACCLLFNGEASVNSATECGFADVLQV